MFNQYSASPKPVYFWGLDLGQAKDYSALSIIERTGASKEKYQFNCLHLQRWQLRTPYPSIVADTVKMLSSEPMIGKTITLAIDNTGVGAPVVDLFKRERLRAKLMPIQITGGNQMTSENGVARVPKRDLVSSVQVNLQNRRLKIASALPDADVLTRELSNFTVKISLDSGHDSYGAWREGTHDDLVLSVALCLWAANRPSAVFRSF